MPRTRSSSTSADTYVPYTLGCKPSGLYTTDILLYAVHASPDGAKMVETASAGNLKSTWTAPNRNWHGADGQGREFLLKATQVKNIWIPYGE